MKTKTEHDYPYAVAGRVWIVPSFALSVLPDGSLAVLQRELDRIHRAICNEICGSPENLTVDELDFLCDVTGTTYTELAGMLDMNRSSLSRWKRPGVIPSKAISNALKRWFWMRVFAEDLDGAEVPLGLLGHDDQLLRYLHQRAIDDGAAGQVERRVA